MKREIRISEDGSHTIYVPDLNEHYHSINGAVTESQHIFIDAAFRFCQKQEVRILEIGFGTGLNTMLTFIEASRQNRQVYYHGVEKYPLTNDEAILLNYDTILDIPGVSVMDFHKSGWAEDSRITEGFTLRKEHADFKDSKAVGPFDVIYFDSFAPDVQPEIWAPAIFKKIYDLTADKGILTTYSVKGDVKRSLKAAGFKVEKIPGPFGKREILRAVKLV